MLALELNDADVVLAEEGRVLAAQSGFALLTDEGVITGETAARQARLTPMLVHSRYWQQLSLDALPRPHPRAATYADLAYTQLTSLLKSSQQAAGAETLAAVPSTYTQEQLGL